ncbi:MAG: sigma-70 family RNA polymerase sigma factor [Acidobacteria bacterium]|nr:sigma-70 family RNA polymerase sigma factor [Acidobacteriota bacterium]
MLCVSTPRNEPAEGMEQIKREMQVLFERLRTGDESAFNELSAVLYQELYRIASRQLRSERSNHTLQPTALVHEAYLKLSDFQGRQFTGEVHFLAVASRVMRQVLVDYARARGSQKRGGDRTPVPMTSLEIESEPGMAPLDLIELNTAIQELAEEDDALARLIEMRYFGGLTAEETAEALGMSVHAVRHDLRYAQAWLRRRLAQG